MPSVSVRKPLVVISGPAGDYHAEGITVSAQVDSAPMVSVIVRRGSERVVEPLSSDTLKAMKKAQEERLKPKGRTLDTAVTAEDGNGGKLRFSGYGVTPVLEHSDVDNSEMRSIVGADAFLDALDMSIYRSISKEMREQTDEDLYTRTPSSSSGDIAATLLEVTKVLAGNIDATLSEIETESLKEMVLRQNANNRLPVSAWTKILQNSSVVYGGLEEAFKSLPELDRALVERMRTMLQQRGSSFWGVLRSIGAEFMFFYKPSLDGQPGKLVKADDKVNGAVTDYKTSVVRFSGNDGSPSMLPLAAVVILGPSLPAIRRETGEAYMNTVVGRWPTELPPGFIFSTQAPAWVSAGAQFSDFAPAAPPPNESGKKDLDPTVYAAQRAALAKSVADLEEPIIKILQSFARVTFEDMQLADSTASLTVPLDFTVEVGRRYRFKLDSAGGGSFTGFVSALRHTLRLQAGTQILAETALSLTHIKYSD